MPQSKVRDVRRRQMRSLATSMALMAVLALSHRCLKLQSCSMLVTGASSLVFPSGDVTPAKLLWLALGLALAGVHLLHVVDSCRATVGRQLVLVDECRRSRPNVLISRLEHVEVETQQFQGHVSITATSSAFSVQLQGRFTRHVQPNSQVVVALELPAEAKELAWTARAFAAAVDMVCRYSGAHTSRGEDDVHVAVPLLVYEFGKSEQRGQRPATSFAVGKLYTLQAEIADWKWRWLAIAALTMAKWFLAGWIKMPPVHFAAYLVTPPSMKERHTTATKRCLFCFSVHRQLESESLEAQRLRISLPRDDEFSGFEVGSPIALYSSYGSRGGGVPPAHAEACRRLAEDARALGRLTFSLDVWVEFVDRVAGRRKVGYLLYVVDVPQQLGRTVMRSATTVKNALLLLRLEHQLDRKETASEAEIAEDDEPVEEQGEEPVDFHRLSVESREYRYQQIEHETSAVAHVLDQVATSPSQARRRWRQPQRCYQNQLEKATLYRCLMSPSRLPSVPSFHGIGVQLNESQRVAMNVVDEAGIYRLHGAGDGTTPLLRQEWLIVSADQLLFFRSFSASPALRVPVTHVLNVCSVDKARLLQGVTPSEAHHDEGSVPRWYCVEIHLVLEIITLFVEASDERDRLVTSLQPLTSDDCCDQPFLAAPAKTATSESVAVSPLFTPMTLTSQNQPVCLNQRTSRFVGSRASSPVLKLVHQSLEAGLEVFALGETAWRRRMSRATVLRFLDTVEELNGIDLDKASQLDNEDRLALGLNLYHTLFIHAVLVFGYPQSHEQWKLLQTVPCYLVRVSGNESVRFTLADIQRVMLRCPVPVSLEASSFKRSLSQNAVMDLAIGGGDAINGLCRAVLGVAWTPVLPSSSSYAAVKKTPLPIPAGLAIDSSDVRTSMVLQINSAPPSAKTTGIMSVYNGGQLNDELNATCTTFLRRELRLDEVNRVIYLPRVGEWYHHDEDVEDQDDGVNRRMDPLTQRRRRSSSGSVGGVAALPKSRSFYCLQRLLGFMEVEQHHRVMHLLLGAGEECRFVFDDFWTRPSRSAAANLLSSAGTAALAVFSRSGSISSEESEASRSDGQQAYF